MEIRDLHKLCVESISEGFNYINLVMDKKPKGFPRGELLCETHRGRLYRYSAIKILDWMNKNNLLKDTSK